MNRYLKHILIISLLGILLIFSGAKCPWEKDKDKNTGSSYTPRPQPVMGTWAWDGTDWTLLHPANEPSGSDQVMVYDSTRQRIVLFGSASEIYYSNTWEWDGTNWIERFSTITPSARHSYAMVYDSTRQKTILFGGKEWGGGGKWAEE